MEYLDENLKQCVLVWYSVSRVTYEINAPTPLPTSRLALPSPPTPLNPQQPKHFFPEFVFFVKIHLLESYKLELYDWYFRSYSLRIIVLEI